MTDLAWSAIRADTIDRFHGQTPRPEDEAQIIDIYEAHPQLVLKAIDEMAQALNQGKVRYGWSALAARLVRGTSALRDVTPNTKQSKLKAIERARTWIKNAGQHYDLERHIRAELFGDDHGSGILSDVTLSDEQQAELIAYWRQVRPIGEQIEREHEERMKPQMFVRKREAPATWPEREAAQEGETCPTHDSPSTASGNPATQATSTSTMSEPSTSTTTAVDTSRSSPADANESSSRGQSSGWPRTTKQSPNSAASSQKPDPMAATTGGDDEPVLPMAPQTSTQAAAQSGTPDDRDETRPDRTTAETATVVTGGDIEW